MAFIYQENNNELIVNDPIHGKIIVPYPFSKIVLTKEMQRLKHISQNGFSQLEFKKLKQNDRLSHSVGAFYIMSLFLERLEEILKKFNIELSKDDKDIALCSMLLHDIGHGPFSHSFEIITKYSHEKRTTDILLGNTELNTVITQLFGKKKVKKIASFIAEINDEDEFGKDSFTKLLKSLVSYQLDADRIDYLMRDAYYVDTPSSIDLNRIIKNMDVIVNNNQEYELVIDRKGLSSIENVLIQRYQMYRDVYLNPSSILGDYIFDKIVERYRNYPNLHTLPLSQSFKVLASNPKISDLNDFLQMIDETFTQSFHVLLESSSDPIMTYLCNFKILDYILIKNNIKREKIITRLKEIFGDISLDQTLSIAEIKTQIKLYKKEQSLKMKNRNRIVDITECTNLIPTQETHEDDYIFFNPEMLRIELGLNEKEFKKYEREIKRMIEELNKKPEEFELKYIIDIADEEDIITDKEALLDRIIEVFQLYGFKIISITEKQNNDEYYDTKELELYKKGGSLRIRKVNKNGKQKIKATYKMPLEKGEVYSSRNEIEENLPDDNFKTLEKIMTKKEIPVIFDSIIKLPILNVKTQRTDVVLERNGVQVCLSYDSSKYTNHFLEEAEAIDKMIEIEAIGELNNRVILNEIHQFIANSFPELSINKQSKYERGVNRTSHHFGTIQTEENIEARREELIKKFQKLIKI